MAVLIGRQFFVAVGFKDFAVSNHEEYIAITDCTKAMRYHDWSASLHSTIKRLLHDLLTWFIEGWRSLVQNQDLWIFDKSSSDGDTLFLTARKFATFWSAVLTESLMELKLSFFVTFPVYIHQLKLMETFLGDCHSILTHLFSDEGRQRLNISRTIFHSPLDGVHIEVPVKLGLVLQHLIDGLFHRDRKFLILMNFGQFITPLKTHDNIFPASSIALNVEIYGLSDHADLRIGFL